ncbi:acyl-CoA synthetase [Jatrophihabitans sp.]|uniref:acyl-CoA synthetase n=1 Tax=Jatrophihabitans sp. TaxID=1932789 RepID=UPI0030C7197D|nr:acyl-CoA synthetase [Jatrophihabitans sp.]
MTDTQTITEPQAGLWNIAREQPGKTAVVDPSGTEIAYGDLAARADAYGRGLQGLGLGVGDVVVAMMPNTIELVALYFAAMECGLYIVPINWHLTGHEVAYIVEDSEAKAFIGHERFAAAATIAAAGIPAEARFAAGSIDGFRPLADLADHGGRPENLTQGAPMVYTSGTTGKPKGVKRPLTGANPQDVPLASSGFFAGFRIKPFDDNVHICGSPLYHTAVLNFVGISIQLGHTVVLMDKFDGEEMLRLIDRYKVTHSHMVPAQFIRLLALPEDVRAKYDVSSLRTMIHGAAPCPNEVKRAMIDWWGPVVVEYYAATEGGGATIFADEWLVKPGSVGKAWSYSIIKILDENGNEVAANQPGLVYMQMGGSSFAYHNAEEKTRESRVGDLFTVGDIGYLDDDGYLFLMDRKNDMIISGGVNIYPAEIEGELVMHPAVADVAVFGVPDDEWGEAIKAVIQPAAGVVPDEALTADIRAFAAERLAKYKLPKHVSYLDELPRDDNGKLYKRKLRDPEWAGREKAI